MSGKLKELLGAAQIRRCVLCGGDKEIAVPNTESHPDEELPSHTYQRCHACCGVGYQGFNHQPATIEQMTHYAELVAKYATETRERNEKLSSKARDTAKLLEDIQRDERRWREMVAFLYCPPPHLYLDDGELQDNRATPEIDFARDRPIDIHNKMIRRSAAVWTKLSPEEIKAAFNGAPQKVDEKT